MSVHSELVRKAIFLKSNVPAIVDPAGNGKFTGIYESKAPEKAIFPYGIFSRIAPEPVEYSFGLTVVIEGDLWLFKVLADEDSSTTKEPQELAEELLVLWMTTLGNTLTLAGASVAWMQIFADMPPYEEKQADRYVYHRGRQMRIRTTS